MGRECIQNLVGKHEGKRLLDILRRRRKYNIRMDLRDVRW